MLMNKSVKIINKIIQDQSKLCGLCRLRQLSTVKTINEDSRKRLLIKNKENSPDLLSKRCLSTKKPSKRIPSGYESESAAIQSSLEQFDFGQLNTYESLDDNDDDGRPVGLSNAMPMRSLKTKSEYSRNFEFKDFQRVRVRGGKGGDGMICFLELYSNPMAGPSGGDGGNGGHVIFEASQNVKSLNNIEHSYIGKPGEKGMHKDMHGASAEHTTILVPVGTLVKDATTGKLLADISEHGMKYMAARGGAGGKGNHYFLNNQNRHPRVAEIGANGEDKKLILELKILAQAGLVGLPNVGKSTLLSAVSRARPKIASYPFTTLKPSVGMIQYDDNEQLAIADLPGIIQDASKNKGLGIAFLKHIERCVCLLYVIDISSTYSPEEQLTILITELEAYKPGLSKRPKAIIVNKMDVDRAEERLEEFKLYLKNSNLLNDDIRIIPISAKYGQNITDLLIQFRQIYDLHRFEQFTKF